MTTAALTVGIVALVVALISIALAMLAIASSQLQPPAPKAPAGPDLSGPMKHGDFFHLPPEDQR